MVVLIIMELADQVGRGLTNFCRTVDMLGTQCHSVQRRWRFCIVERWRGHCAATCRQQAQNCSFHCVPSCTQATLSDAIHKGVFSVSDHWGARLAARAMLRTVTEICRALGHLHEVRGHWCGRGW